MKKMILFLLMLFAALNIVPALAENGTVTVFLADGAQLTLKYEGYQIVDGQPVIRISGFGNKFFTDSSGSPYSPVLPQIRSNGVTHEYKSLKTELSTSGIYTFTFDKSAPRPEMIYVTDVKDGRSYRLWYDPASWNPETNPDFLQNEDKGSDWCLARFTLRTPDMENGFYAVDATRDLLAELVHDPMFYVTFKADGNLATNFDLDAVMGDMIPNDNYPAGITVSPFKFFFNSGFHLTKDTGWRWRNGKLCSVPSGDCYDVEYDQAEGIMYLSFRDQVNVENRKNRDGEFISKTGRVEMESVQEYIPCAAYQDVIDALVNAPVESLVFGRYEQDNDPSNGPEDIEWNVLVNDGEGPVLISKYILDAKAYNEDPAKKGWDQSPLRSWLNGEFLNTAFTDEEQERILTTTVTADANPIHPEDDQGADTQDKVWLLSAEEAGQWFAIDENRMAWSTEYAKAHGARNTTMFAKADESWLYWLRTVFYPAGSFKPRAAEVYKDGRIMEDGPDMDSAYVGVRPVIRLRISD